MRRRRNRHRILSHHLARFGTGGLLSTLLLGACNAPPGAPSRTPRTEPAGVDRLPECPEGVRWVDRVEAGRAVLVDEAGWRRIQPVSELPDGAAEGDAIHRGRLLPSCRRAMRRDVRRRRRRLLRRTATGSGRPETSSPPRATDDPLERTEAEPSDEQGEGS